MYPVSIDFYSSRAQATYTPTDYGGNWWLEVIDYGLSFSNFQLSDAIKEHRLCSDYAPTFQLSINFPATIARLLGLLPLVGVSAWDNMLILDGKRRNKKPPISERVIVDLAGSGAGDGESCSDV